MTYKTVAVWGATGNVGPTIVNHLVSAGLDVVILSRRSTRPEAASEKARIIQIDITKEHDRLVSILRGIDVVVSITGETGLHAQPALIDAAIEAGVKLFFPSEYGGDMTNQANLALPIFAEKVKTMNHLKQKAAEGKIGYVLLQNAAFLDWGLIYDFLINVSGSAPTTIWNGGDVKFSATKLDDLGKALASIVKNPEPYWSRQVLINSTVTTQNELLAAAKKAKPDAKWKTTHQYTVTARERGEEIWTGGKGDLWAAIYDMLPSATFDTDYGVVFDQADSKELGIKYLSNEEVETVVREIVLKYNKE
ncbi:Hypothetical protein D9617_9g025840 [Elsinoe fawcettii]|nr:Hypothetical protein D9617_9g025840 [Elsinoe fawcettii]